MTGLRQAVERREPWPLSQVYGAEPESNWGPKEVLAHVAEMVPYWLDQIEVVRPRRWTGCRSAGWRRIPSGSIGSGVTGRCPRASCSIGSTGPWRTRRALPRRLDADAKARRGTHPRLGEMTIDGMVERFIVGHLEEHVRQLEEILARGPGVADATS